jgi:hypothetical protein
VAVLPDDEAVGRGAGVGDGVRPLAAGLRGGSEDELEAVPSVAEGDWPPFLGDRAHGHPGAPGGARRDEVEGEHREGVRGEPDVERGDALDGIGSIREGDVEPVAEDVHAGAVALGPDGAGGGGLRGGRHRQEEEGDEKGGGTHRDGVKPGGEEATGPAEAGARR